MDTNFSEHSLPTISVATITKNEEHNVEPFLYSLEGVADELIVVDTGSTDNTREAFRSGAQRVSYPVHIVEKHLDPFHFGRAKNSAIGRARCDYVLVLDADERLSDEFRTSIKKFLRTQAPIVVSLPRIDELLPHYTDTQIRLFKNGEGIRYGEDLQSLVHEALQFSVKVTQFDAPVLHLQGKNHWLRRPARVRQQLNMEIQRTSRVRSRLSELAHAPLGFFYKFRSVYVRRKAYKDGWFGFVYAFRKGKYVFWFHIGVALKPKEKHP